MYISVYVYVCECVYMSVSVYVYACVCMYDEGISIVLV